MLFVVATCTNAQEVTIPAGGEASGSGGMVSYTVGQVFYNVQMGTDGKSTIQGVQQPYEISVVTGVEEAKGIHLDARVFPNPTADYLTIRLDAKTPLDIRNLRFLVVDINGRLLQTVEAKGRETRMEMTNLVGGTYYVKVLEKNNELKVFKMVKSENK